MEYVRLQELFQISGIGEMTRSRIFEAVGVDADTITVEELKQIKGIGKRMLMKIEHIVKKDPDEVVEDQEDQEDQEDHVEELEGHGKGALIFYDFEVFKHDWCVVFIDPIRKDTKLIVNNPDELIKWYEANKNAIWVGYNSRRYDQYIFKSIMLGMDPKVVNDMMIIDKKGGWEISPDFNKIQFFNFDIMTSFHGLKQLEGFMGHSIKDTTVPFDIDRKLTQQELEEVVEYCFHDVEQTIQVFIRRKEEFESQLSLVNTFDLPMGYISKTKPQLSAIILEARRTRDWDDEFDFEIVDTLRLNQYDHIKQWYLNKNNHSYEKQLDIDVAGVPHTFAWGGIHGAIPKCHAKGMIVNVDVASYYPAMMIEYNFGSRNIAKPEKYREIRDERIELKAKKDPKQLPFKIVLNSTYGAMKDKFNDLYDPRQANNVCVNGQLLLLDLIEKIETRFGNAVDLIQSNTDGLFLLIKDPEDFEELKGVCNAWEDRTRFELEFELFDEVFQKDVNNYIIINHKTGAIECKGAYVKNLHELDNDLPIVNKAVKDYFTNGTHPSETINASRMLIDFQKIVKVSSKYSHAVHGSRVLSEKTIRVFASKDINDGGIYKVKKHGSNPEKFALTPEQCFIQNDEIKDARVPRKLNREWYLELAKKRLCDYGVDI